MSSEWFYIQQWRRKRQLREQEKLHSENRDASEPKIQKR